MMLDPSAPDPRRSKKATEALALKFLVIGCFLLPFVWLHSLLYFRKTLFNPEAPKRAKLYIFISVGLFVAELVVLACWLIIYSAEWNDWGTVGESLSVTYPRG
mmetsp:Transcript_2365/g.2904  ORF Transcript_2365/g.2904 Transcript_2365/m.2904 type:complete len:103 (-) Transcript_2365:89-397(-)